MRRKREMMGLPACVLAMAGCAAVKAPMLPGGKVPLPEQVGDVRVADLTDANRMVVKHVHVDAPREEVFAYLIDFESMPDWFPGLNKVSVDNRESANGPEQIGVGTLRACELTGASVAERVVHYDRPNAFAYTITSKDGPAIPVTKGTGLVTLTPTRDGGTDVEYRVFYETNPWHPMSPVFPVAMGRQLGEGLANLGEHFATQNIASKPPKSRVF
ncbi:MAG: SRPBCC family protein [Planctomycetota bacterium]